MGHDRLRTLIDNELDDLVRLRHDLHAHPEPGYEEHRTSAVVQRELTRAGIEHRGGLAGGTGIIAHLPSSTSGPAVLLRADMDALRMPEETGLPWASVHEGRMHACGHDGHVAILVGVARVLAKLEADGGLPRPVTLVFQPAEEGGAGGKRMVEEGCLDGSVLGPPVEQAFALHAWPLEPLGTVASRVGPMLAATARFEVIVRGKGGHAALPEQCRDPVLAGAAVVTALQQIASRNADPLDSVVVSVTRIHGGTAHNIIPEEVRLGGTVRTLHSSTEDMVRARLAEISSSVARAHGCEAELVYQRDYPVTTNHPAAVEAFRSVAVEAIGEERVLHTAVPVMGGEDFSYYGQQVPACFFTLGLQPAGEDPIPGLHHPRFDFDDRAIALGVEVLCRLALHTGER